ncbi:MAG TPA: ubiquitin-like protein UBact [Abditibacteriaceae bacterium]
MNIFRADETQRRSLPSDPITKPGGDDAGPSAPKVKKPDTRQLLDRMKRVDPDQAKNYRQRSGQ